MSNTEQFAGLTLEEMLKAIDAKLVEKREAEKKEATVKLGELFAKKAPLEEERDQILVNAAFERVSSMKKEEIERFDIRDETLGTEGVTLTLSVHFKQPKRVTELEDQISEINGEIGMTKNQAALDLDQEATSAKELALVYLARRMSKGSTWDEPKHPVPPLKISRGPMP